MGAGTRTALSQPAFFIGPMGSCQTHANCLRTLRGRGVRQGALERIVSPLGLIPSARAPATLALSRLRPRSLRLTVASQHRETANPGQVRYPGWPGPVALYDGIQRRLTKLTGHS
ncbi:XdhC family protein [Microvirga puerhi]|uniref:XdhC family protein n=1 Tax=Microvirga puerhi TaxID=2876078 RepID=A0ABS7VRT3_9HYPH|nr:XdhC family protein [Microvirga puerhi]